jgi:hypothetical protein
VKSRRSIHFLLGLALCLAGALPAAADDTLLSVVAVRVNPGQLQTYAARVGQLEGIMERLGVDATIAIWQATAAGEATGTVFVALQYPSLAAYAEGTAKSQGDAEFTKLIGGLDDVRTVASSSLYRNVHGGGGNDPGELLQTVTVKVAPGHLDEYLAKIQQLQAISERVGGGGTMRVWQATAAGPDTGNLIVGIIHENLVSYANSTTKIQADPEWQQLVAGLDDIRTIVSTGLSRRVTP